MKDEDLLFLMELDEEEDRRNMVLYLCYLCSVWSERLKNGGPRSRMRNPYRMDWKRMLESKGLAFFQRWLRMPFNSFVRLASMLTPWLKKNPKQGQRRGGIFSPE